MSEAAEGLGRRRQARREAERKRRAARRRRRALVGIALVSLVAGAAVGSGREPGGGAGNAEDAQTADGSQGAGPSGSVGGGQPEVKLVRSQDPVPVLMYHAIADPPAGANLPELYVDPKTFKQQMRWLRDQGYTAVTLKQVSDAWFEDAEIPEKPVVLSFDDGYRGHYVFARRDLRELGWPGVLNLKLSTLEPGGELSEQMVRQMVKDGWEIASHTIDHLDVSQLSGAALQREVGESRRLLQQRFDQPVDFFCYPAGKYDSEAIEAVKRAGYLGATTVDDGLASKDEMFTLKRVRVDGSDGVAGLRRKLDTSRA